MVLPSVVEIELEVDRPQHVRRVGLDRRDRGHPGPIPRRSGLDLQAFFVPGAPQS
jgi:hypothetical protein